MPSSMSADIKEQFIEANQAHLFHYWDELTSDEQANLLSQLSQFQEPCKLIESAKNAINFSASNSRSSRNFKPLPQQSHSSLLTESERNVKQWESKGLELINKGEVAVILMAGGQGTRLGSTKPKGCYDIGLPSHKSLFQIQAERILKVAELSNKRFGNEKARIPWYIMTSSNTKCEIESFFEEHSFFGFPREDVIFFNQGTLPCFSMDGSKILLESKSSISESPDGNGGLYRAIHNAKLLEDFARRNVKHIHMYCVDNCLARVSDPVFIGWSALNNYQLSTKVVRKRNASEKVGLIVLDADKNCPCVIEYSEISQELSERTAEDGSLYLKAANIVNHYYSVELLKSHIGKWISSQDYLPFHIAKKKINYWDVKTNHQITPSEPNGIKLEQFIFDVFPSIELEKFGCLEVDRSEEFSPLKNGPGSGVDCPETARRDSLALGTKWVKENGGILKDENAVVEVSVLTSYSGEGLSSVQGKTFEDGDII